MLRVSIASNCSQILFLSTALRQSALESLPQHCLDILLLSCHTPNPSSETRETMLAVAQCVWSWLDIIWIDPYIQRGDGGQPCVTDANCLSHLTKPYGQPEQVWCCMPHNIEAQTVLSTFPEAELHVYEDGLGTYIDLYTPLRLLQHPHRLLKRSWTLLRHKQRWLSKLFARSAHQYPFRLVSRLHFFLASELCLPSHFKRIPVSHIDAQSMLQTIGTVQKALSLCDDNATDHSAEKRVLITGQYYCQIVAGAWRQEFEMHTQVIQFYQRQGYDVWWREHPKAQQPFGEAFAKHGIGVRTFNTNPNLPVELLITKEMFQQHVSVCSTSLYTLKKLYHIEPRTCIDLMSFRVPGTFEYVKSLIHQSIRNYDST